MVAERVGVFDVDGTDFKSSLVEKFAQLAIERRLFNAEPFNRVYDDRRRWQDHNTEKSYNLYLSGLVGAFVAQMAGVEVAHAEALAGELVREHTVRRFRFPRKLMRVIAPSHRVIAISGSPEFLVRPFMAGLPVDDVFGSEYITDGGVFTGEAHGVGRKDLILGRWGYYSGGQYRYWRHHS